MIFTQKLKKHFASWFRRRYCINARIKVLKITFGVLEQHRLASSQLHFRSEVKQSARGRVGEKFQLPHPSSFVLEAKTTFIIRFSITPGIKRYKMKTSKVWRNKFPIIYLQPARASASRLCRYLHKHLAKLRHKIMFECVLHARRIFPRHKFWCFTASYDGGFAITIFWRKETCVSSRWTMAKHCDSWCAPTTLGIRFYDVMTIKGAQRAQHHAVEFYETWQVRGECSEGFPASVEVGGKIQDDDAPKSALNFHSPSQQRCFVYWEDFPAFTKHINSKFEYPIFRTSIDFRRPELMRTNVHLYVH